MNLLLIYLLQDKKSIMKKQLLNFTILLTFLSCANKKNNFSLNELKWIDLTYSFDSTTLYWPNNAKGFEHHTDAEGITPLGFYYSSYKFKKY